MSRQLLSRLLGAALVAVLALPFAGSQSVNADVPGGSSLGFDMYRRPAPDLDIATTMAAARAALPDQVGAFELLKANTGGSARVRWNEFGGSPDVVMDFATASYPGTPEEAARAFVADNAALFGVASPADLRLVRNVAALGGHMLRFQQTFNGIDVKDGGIGVVMTADNRVVMASGPFFRDVSVDTAPSLSAEDAAQRAAADLERFRIAIPAAVQELLAPALDLLASQVSAVAAEQPRLGIYPTATDYRLVWKVPTFSTNPFGLYLTSVDAHTGEIVARKDYVAFAQEPTGTLPFTADIYPKYPTITPELKDQGIISVGPDGTPLGQERVQLRKIDPSSAATGVEGTLTGTHTIVNNALATKLPFGQAARGTWHFRVDDPTNLEARTNEQDHLAEPAEHQDEINAFFFVTYLLEYIDHLHVGGDQGIGQGSFPDSYPNKTIPLPATVHIPNIYIALDIAEGNIPNPADPTLAPRILGLDNAFALNVTSLLSSLTGTENELVVNPTSYGHGFYFNDLALEGTVPYHEGMHAITSPIAGLEGDPEGGALNEGQADMWAFTITDNPSLGDYVVNAYGIRNRYRELGRNPDSIAYIRSARSTLKYSDIGTLVSGGVAQFEEHYDGEIYMSTTWDIREMLNAFQPAQNNRRPAPADGSPTKTITQGTNTFERIFLGSMYVLGTTAPDTMVKARDAMLVADQLLYPSNAVDPAAPGLHRALIEQVFAAHELGVNAQPVTGGVATISTQVTPFVGEQEFAKVPQKVEVVPASPRSLRVSWQPVDGAVGYEVLKRRSGLEGQREPNGKREYLDGDASTTGFRHVAYVYGATQYEDKGKVQEIFAPAGIDDLFSHEYVVRAVGRSANGQVALSRLSGSAKPRKSVQDVTDAVRTAISNVSFANGVFSFDQTLTNLSGAHSIDKTIYGPIEFRITKISDRTVTVRNADTAAPVPTFLYNQTLALGATSSARRIEFNDPQARLFTFEAVVFGGAYNGTIGGRGSQAGDGSSEPPEPVTYSINRQNYSGTLPLGDPTGITHGGGLLKEDYYADPNFKGVTYMDVPVTTVGDALSLDAKLSSTLAVDMDFELRTADGTLLARSAGATAAERITALVEPNTQYILRVIGWANGPADFAIESDQLLPVGSPNENAGTVTPSGTEESNTPPSGAVLRLLRFVVNPLTRSVTVSLL
jgi:hypothetical protein